jgi:hypothetical protein
MFHNKVYYYLFSIDLLAEYQLHKDKNFCLVFHSEFNLYQYKAEMNSYL